MFSVFIYYKLLLFWTYLYTYLGYFCEIRERGITLLKDINIFNFITDFPPSIVAVYMPTKNNNWLFFFNPHFYFFFNKFKSLRGAALHGSCALWSWQEGCFGILAQTVPVSLSTSYLPPDPSGFVQFGPGVTVSFFALYT